jgi:S-(hydroxymethyl)glutathione synthase
VLSIRLRESFQISPTKLAFPSKPSQPAMPSLHPTIDKGINQQQPDNGSGGKLRCKCSSQPVEITLDSNVAFNHACGCSKCWKPAGALFSVVGVVPREKLRVSANSDKLRVVDSSAVIQRNACKDCGVHLFGRIEADHAFKGLDFVHVELGEAKDGWQKPLFAAFVSSIIEQGFEPEKMGDVRAKFEKEGLKCYDCLSPELMDLIAAHTAKKAGKSK